jgi:hypothetical protein
MTTRQCQHCGALLTAPVATCSYCGAPQRQVELPAGCIPLVDDHVIALLKRELTGVDSTYTHPSIPAKKLTNARVVHAAHLPPNEQVLGLYDGTAFGSAKDGFLVTSKRICWKNQLEDARCLEWAHVDMDNVYVDGNRFVFGRAKIDTLFSEDDDGLWAWEGVLQTLARSAHPEQARKETMPAPSDKPDPGWGGNEAIALSQGGGAWGGTAASQQTPSAAVPRGNAYAQPHNHPEVERLIRAPYEFGDSCSIVDIHPSGALIAACGGNVVELRQAANGARFGAFVAPDTLLFARFSPDGQWLLVGGLDNRANLYEVRTGDHRGTTTKMTDSCDEVVWLGRSHYFAAASQRGELWIVDASTMRETVRILGPDPQYNQLGGLAASPDGGRVYVSLGGRLGAFESATGKILWRNDNALNNSSRLTLSPRGDVLMAAGYDGVAFFDPINGRPGARYPFPCARNVSWPEQGERGFLGRKKQEEGLWSWSPRPRFSPTGDLIAVQDHVGNLAFVDPTTGALHPTGRELGRAWIEDLAWFPDGNHLVVGASDNTLSLWRVRPMTGLWRVQAIVELPDDAYARAYRHAEG